MRALRRSTPRRGRAVGLAGLLALAWIGCGGPGAPGSDTVLATFEGGEILAGELERARSRRAREQGKGRRTTSTVRLEDLALREILAAAAPRDDPELEAAAREAGEAIYEEAQRERLGWTEIDPSEAEMRRYYDERPEAFTEPERLRLQHVFLRSEASAATDGDRADARVRLEAIRRRAMAGADFSALARAHSDSADGPAGGWMVLERGTPAVRAFTDVVWALAEEEISPVIETPVGFHIARVATRIPARLRPYGEVRDRVAAELRAARLEALEAEFVGRVGAEHGVQRRYEVLARGAPSGDTVLFSVAGKPFSVADMLRRFSETHRSHYYAGYFRRIEEQLDREILRRLLVLEAVASGLDRDPEVRDEVEARMLDLRAEAELERRLAARVEALGDEVLRRHYDRAPSRYEAPRLRSISLIRLAPSEREGLWSLLRRGERLVEALRGGDDFATAARRDSRDPSAPWGGRLTALTDEELAVRVPTRSRGRRIVDELEIGEISQAFIGEVYDPGDARMVPTGVYVVRLDDETPPRLRTFEEAGPLVASDFLRREHGSLAAALRREILSEASFRVVGPR